MDLSKFLEKKLIGSPEDRSRRKEIEKKADSARWQARERGAIAKARSEGYAQGRGTGGGGFVNTLANIGAGINASPVFANSFSTGNSRRSGHRSRTSDGRGTTIKVNGATITVNNKKRTQHLRRRCDESDLLF